jgi:Resolvase, N terminal domain
MTIYGYARVSTAGQELDIQLAQLRASGCIRIFCEKESGTKDERRELRRMLRVLKPGDVVIVAALDRLTRGGPFKMLSILNEITSRRSAYKSLAEPWADTTHELGEVLVALLGYIARKGREDITGSAGIPSLAPSRSKSIVSTNLSFARIGIPLKPRTTFSVISRPVLSSHSNSCASRSLVSSFISPRGLLMLCPV